MQSGPRVFISYCRSDGTTFATQLRERLEKEHPDIKLWLDVISERPGRDWWLQITEALDQVEYMVLVLTPDAIKSPTVRREWRYARQMGVCVYPIQAGCKLELTSLPRWIRDLHIDELSLDEQQGCFGTGPWQRLIRHLNARCETPRVPFMAEDLPENFVERPQEFERLVRLLRDEKMEEPVAITTAIHGTGGYGKTTLALAVCHDERIQEAFDDGVLWTTLGENPGDLTVKVVDLIENLSGERPGFRGVEGASARLSELLADRDILLVIDDVWNAVHLRPFLNGGPRCARLFTTRNLETIPAGAHLVEVDAMQQSEAVRLLAAGLEADRSQVAKLGELSEKLGEWPLLLRLVNRVLWDRVQLKNQPLDAACDYAAKALARHGLTAFDARAPQAREQAVGRTLGVSLNLLTERERERFFELAIFPEDLSVPLSTISRLWSATGGTDDLEAEEICARLHGLSLLLSFDLNTRRLRLHDVIRKFLGSRLRDAASVHAKLIDAWGDLRRLPDPYAWRFFAYHMANGSRGEQLREMLLDFDWMRGKLEATEIASLPADYDYLTDHDADCRMIQGALQLSAHVLAGNEGREELAGQLLGRLLNNDSPVIQAFLSHVGQRQNASSSLWLRPISAALTPPGGPLLRTLEGHNNSVSAVALTPDGSLAISPSWDRTVRVWELKTGKLLHTLEGHSGPVITVVVTPDGSQAASGSWDHTVKVWELKTGRLLHTLEGHNSSVEALAVTPDGMLVVSGSHDGTLKIWELKTGQLLRSIRGHTGWVDTLAITPDGSWVISGSDDCTRRVWDLKTGRALYALDDFRSSAKPVAVTPDGEWAVSPADNYTLKVWELKTGRILHLLAGHGDWVQAVAITPDGAQAISASYDGTLKIWELKTGRLLRSLQGHQSGILDVAITEDGMKAVSASIDSTLKVWELATGKILHSLEGHNGSVAAVVIAPNGEKAISASSDHTLKIWNLKTARPVHSIKAHTAAVISVAATPDSAWAVSASEDRTVKVWDLKTGGFICSLEGHRESILNMAITPDGTRCISASKDQTLKVWDLKTGNLMHSLEGHTAGVWGVAVIAHGAEALSAGNDRTLKVWDLQSGRLLRSIDHNLYATKAVATTPDGAHALLASERTVKTWDLKSGHLLRSIDHDAPLVFSMAVTPDGAYAVLGCDNGLKILELRTDRLLHLPAGFTTKVAVTSDSAYAIAAHTDLKVYEIQTGRLLQTLKGHTARVEALAIPPGNAHVISACGDHTLKVWNLQTGRLAATFTGETGFWACAVSADGKTVIAGGYLGRMHFLRLAQPLTS